VSARLGEVNLKSDCDEMVDADFLNAIDSIFGDLRRNDSSLGENASTPCAATPQDIAVEGVEVHPEFKYSFHDGFPNDLALVRLKEKVKIDQFVRPICLSGLDTNLTAKEEEQGLLSVAGWGMTSMDGD